MDKKSFNVKEFTYHNIKIAIIAIYALSLLIIFIIVFFANKSLVDFENKVNQKSKELTERQASLKEFAKVKDEFPDFSSNVDLLEKIVEVNNKSKVDIGQFLFQVASIISDSNLSLNSISPTFSEENLRVTIMLSGNFNDFLDFLNNLENNIVLLEIKSFSVNGFGADSSYELEISLI